MMTTRKVLQKTSSRHAVYHAIHTKLFTWNGNELDRLILKDKVYSCMSPKKNFKLLFNSYIGSKMVWSYLDSIVFFPFEKCSSAFCLKSMTSRRACQPPNWSICLGKSWIIKTEQGWLLPLVLAKHVSYWDIKPVRKSSALWCAQSIPLLSLAWFISKHN